MNKKFTKLIAAIALLVFMTPMAGWGQTRDVQQLTNANIVAAGNASTSYASWTITDDNNHTWNAYAIKNKHSNATSDYHYLQIKKYASSTAYYIQVPELGTQITSITMTVSSSSQPMTGGSNTATLYFSNSNSTSSTGTGVASGTGASSVTIDCSSLNLNTGYITASGAVRIWDVSVTYTAGGTPSPSMSVSTNSIDFGSNTINPSEPYTQTFNVTFANLKQDLTVTGFTGVTVSPATIAHNDQSPKTVTVSYNPTAAGSITGSISVNSSEVTEQLVAVSGSAYDPENVDTYEKYTSTLVEGDYVIINSTNAMKNTLYNSRFTNESVIITNNTITNPATSIIWHIAPIENTNYWTIYNGAVGKYAGGTSNKNQGALLNEVTTHAQWIITIGSGGICTIENYGRSQDSSDPDNRYLRNNGSNGWATYASNLGGAPQLYKKVIANQVAAPTFGVAAGTYYETKSVELSCETTGATIYYTTDGTIPSASNGTEYTTAISVSSTMTIKAIAVKDGMADSDVATAAYVIQLPYSTIPDILAAATSTSQAAKVTFGGWLVTGINGGQVFVTDGTNGLIIYQSGHGFAVGNTLTGTVDCNIVLFNTSAEITGVTASNTNLTIGSGTATPNVTTIDALGSVNTGSVVTLNNLNYNGSVLSDGTNEITPFNTLYSDAAYVNGETYNITGVFFQNNTEKRILPRSSADIVEVVPQHDDYILTIDADSHVTEYFIFNEADQTVPYTITNSTATIQDGTTVLVSLGIEDGYVVDEITVTYGNSQSATITTIVANVEYTFTMPAVNATLSVTTKEAPVVTTYTLVTAQAQLMPGKHYIIVGSNASGTEYYAMGEQTTSGSNKIRAAVSVTKTGTSTIQGTDDVCEFVISGDATNGWTFYDESANYYLKGINGNELDYSASLLAEYCYWTIDFNANANVLELIQSNKYTDRYINFNNGTNPKRFANYKTSSSQRPVSIYVKDGDNDLELYSPTTLSNTNTITVPAYGILTVNTNSLTNSDAANLIIEDGGQLITDYAVKATVKKTISGHGSKLSNAGWNFIASPVIEDLDPANVTNLLNGSYDLYRFNQNADLEWENYKAHTSDFVLANGQGYLYANNAQTDIEFAGTVSTNGQVSLSYLESNPDSKMWGWNLVGNPFPCNATVNSSCYTIQTENEKQVIKVASDYTVAPCEGVMVKATGTEQSVTFTKVTTVSGASQPQQLQITLTQEVTTRGNAKASYEDNAIVSFNEGSQLEKFYFGEGNANIYIPQNGKEYAIAVSEAQGEMPVNFKAAEDGSYTLTVSPENVEMHYLHLIDNLTGANIDLLQTPSYTFNASVMDYASRFRLVFCTGSAFEDENGDNVTFAYYNGSEWVLASEGEATLQVVDMMGRVLSSETVNGNASVKVNAPAGVYVLRLVNGEKVMTQKIVVR